MKRLIFLHTKDHNANDKKLDPKQLFSALKSVRDASFSEFRKELKLSKFAKLVKIDSEHEVSPQVVISYQNDLDNDVCVWLRKVEVVEVIDGILQ